MAEKYLEREVKLDVDAAFRLPSLSDLVPPGCTLEAVVVPIDSIYFDTAQHDLMRANVTLRRRHGDPSDTGWQLKVPTKDARTELRLPPAERAAVPKELRDLTAGLRRGRSLRQVACIHTERKAHRLLDVSGAVLVEVADDEVRAATLGANPVSSKWREVEVELGAGDGKLIRAIVNRLRKAGAHRSACSSKLARAMAEQVAREAGPTGRVSGADCSSVGDLVLGYLLDQRQDLLDGDLELRGGSDVVHRTRVAARRFRSTLRTFGVFDAERAAALEAELAWYAGLLGAVRDRDVLRVHLSGLIAGLPDDLVPPAAASALEQYLIEEREHHRRALLRALNGRRYFALLDAIDQWLAEPPFTEAAQAAPAQARAWARRAERELRKRLRVVTAGNGDPERMHRARKAAKRARYAIELAGPVLTPKLARRTIKQTTAIQDTLGEFQDSVVACETLLRLGARVGTTPNEHGFTYGLLYALELHQAEQSRQRIIAQLA